MDTGQNNLTSKIMKYSTVIGLIGTALFIIYGFKSGIFTSQEALSDFLMKFGFWGPCIFILIQVVQVVIPILPGAVGCVAGVLIFGPIYGFLYNYIGICIGSVCAFLISKKYGITFVRNLVNQKTYDKYIGWIDRGKKFDTLFAAAIFFPVAPDDFLCYLAGLTRMNVQKFSAIIFLCKPFSIFIYSIGMSSITHMIANVFA